MCISFAFQLVGSIPSFHEAELSATLSCMETSRYTCSPSQNSTVTSSTAGLGDASLPRKMTPAKREKQVLHEFDAQVKGERCCGTLFSVCLVNVFYFIITVKFFYVQLVQGKPFCHCTA